MQDLTISEHHQALIKRASLLSVLTAVFLLLLKLTIWLASDSVAVLSSLTDSLMDIIASGINFFAIRYAMIPADHNHSYGHAKAEALAALGQALIIGSSALGVFWFTFERLQNPVPISSISLSLWVMVFSTLISIALLGYQRWVYLKTKSLAIQADSEHYKSDVFINAAVILALYGVTKGWDWLDPVVSLIVVFLLLNSSLNILKEVFKILMDESLAPEDEKNIKQIVINCEQVKGLRKIQTRRTGAQIFIQIELELDAKMNLKQAKNVCECVKDRIKQAYPNAEISIQQEPVD